MPFLDGFEVRNFIDTHPLPARIKEAYSLRSLLHTATYKPGYIADSRWCEALKPSDAGNELLARMSSQAIPEADIYLALFGLFWFQDPLIDFAETDFDLIRNIVDKEALEQKFYLPLMQGRLIYDRYHGLKFSDHDNITAKETALLLEGTPVGVYQSGSLVTGPLGIIDSQCVREFSPMQTLGLWHCPMLDCGDLHGVNLVPPNIQVVEAYRLLQQISVKLWNTESRWENAIACWPYPLGEEWRAYSEMPLFLGECILGEDRKRLLIKILTTEDGKAIRDILKNKTNIILKDPSTLVDELSAEHQLQLLLLLPDGKIKKLLDELVFNGAIDVPTTEVREVDSSKRKICHISKSNALELSSLGIRTTRHHPILLFSNLVWNAYVKHNELGELDWRLQKPANKNTRDALMEFIRTATPPVAIERLILSSPRITAFVAESIEADINTPSEHARTIIEWKLGFDLPRDDKRLKTIRSVITTFKNTLSEIGVPESDDHRQSIRAAGVNAFVELEGFLHEFISYNAWILSSDHPRVTRFIYDRNVAAERVPHALGSTLSSGAEAVTWNVRGNTLGTCLRYLQELCRWVDSLSCADREPLARKDKKIHRSSDNDVTIFPFSHTELWADSKPENLSELAELINKSASILNKVDVAGIRNGLEHYREASRFPTIDRIVSVAEGIRDFVEIADRSRLFPKLYWRHGSQSDPFCQRTIDFIDYSGSRFQVHMPQTIFGTLQGSDLIQTRPVLIAPGNIFGLPNADLIFQARQESVYSRYWESYPAYTNETILLELDD